MLSLPGTANDSTSDFEPEVELQKFGRWALFAVAFLIFGLGSAAAFIPIGGAVIGTGNLTAESGIKTITHPNGGVLQDILVEDGDRVEKGQLLVRFDTNVSEVSADLSGRTVNQLMAQKARLEAEREGLGRMRLPAELARRDDPAVKDAIEAEQRLLALHQQERRNMRSQLSERISQLNEQISGYRSQIAALQRQQALIQPEREGVKQLWDEGLVTIDRLNRLERSAVDIDGSIASLRANIAQTGARISETREQIISIDATARSEAGDELAQVTSALNDQRIRNADADDQFERSTIRAPYDGVVDKLAFRTIGGVVQPAEPIMEIVPTGDQLVVEASISPTDIDRVREGQNARLRLSAFNMTTTPEIHGVVTYVSAERTTNPEQNYSYYRVRVTLDKAEVERENLQLKAGMPVEVFISTGSRSMLSYITKPLRDQFARAFNQ